MFLNQLPGFSTLPSPFQGILRVAATSGSISVIGLRGRYNERRDFLIATTPAANEATAAFAGDAYFPYLAEGGGYAEHKYVSSFVGFGPVSRPRFIVAVMLDEPQGVKHFGGDVAAPVFSTVMGAALRMMAVPPDAPGTLNVQAPRDRGEG